MNDLFLLVKTVSVVFYAQKLGDKDIITEMSELVSEIPKFKDSLVAVDKRVDVLLRELIAWVSSQPLDEPIIKSIFNTKIAEIQLVAPDMTSSFKEMFDEEDEDTIRKIIFQNIKDVRNSISASKINFKLKNLLKPLIFEGEKDLSKSDWLKLADILDNKISTFNQEVDKAVIEEISTDKKDKMVELLEQFKMDLSPEGVLKTGFQGINESLGDDGGYRRGLFYLINALTNRGKSFFLAHLLSSFVLYNDPLLRDKSKIPTIFFCSAEDSLPLIIRRMYEIFYTAKTGVMPEFFDVSSNDIVDYILATFKERGWHFAFYRVDPSHDSIRELKQRVRNLEIRGHEIIVGAYDYLGMMNLDGCGGETRSDKLQDLIRQVRNFWIARNAVGISPHQLNPKAKEVLRENDDMSEINFVREVGGNSMTEGSTKVTNEVDVEQTIHVAKLLNNKSYLTYYVGKYRGDAVLEALKYGIYELEQSTKEKRGRGLVHDINLPKALHKRTLVDNTHLEMALEEL